MKRMRKLLGLLLAFVFFMSVTMQVRIYIQNQESEHQTQEAKNIAAIPEETSPGFPVLEQVQESNVPLQTEAVEEPPPTEMRQIDDPIASELYSIDIPALKAVNPDVIGWIRIPGTNIDYPILQGDDNSYYLNHTWKGGSSYVGSIFMEWQNHADFLDDNSILYGHNLKNGTMFTSLHSYRKEAFYREHPYVYIVTETATHRYAIFAVLEIPKTDQAYRLVFDEEFRKQDYIHHSLTHSRYDTGRKPTEEDLILTLSTCTGGIRENRWVVQAYKEGQLEEPQTE